ncbi:MAG: ribonuclease [Actinomycetota bacterium]
MSLEQLIARLGVAIDLELLEQALTHPSHSYERGGRSYQRLEFLGDSILGLVVAEHVYSRFPDWDEGELTKLKNSLVSAQSLSVAAERLDLGPLMKLGKGEERTRGREKKNLLADAMESVIGASYLSGGLEVARRVVEVAVLPLMDNPELIRESADPKTSLQERLARERLDSPRYEVSAVGPDHAREYTAVVFSGNSELGSGTGSTRRRAETAAAATALRKLNA